MSRFVFLALCALVVVVLGGVLIIGAFPPHPRPEQVQRVLPNDRFPPR